MMSIVVATMAVTATFILIKSKIAFRGRKSLIEFQHSVAAVALVFCLTNIPCTVVYWWRAIILPRPFTEVPILARQIQVSQPMNNHNYHGEKRNKIVQKAENWRHLGRW